MVLRTKFFLLFFVAFALFTLSGCYNTPVRHLTSDVALLKVGESTEEDVLIFLGEPDDRQELAEGVEEWFYKNTDMTFLEKAPWVGKHFGTPQYTKVTVTMTSKIVTAVAYSSTDEDDMDWADDYPWQEKKE